MACRQNSSDPWNLLFIILDKLVTWATNKTYFEALFAMVVLILTFAVAFRIATRSF